MPEVDCSVFLPTFLKRLADPSIKTVLLCGCGGGFDFVHSLVLYPKLRRLDKSVIVGSYSFGDPIEDAVSVTTVASLNLKAKILICTGLGADRFNHVSDAASLRAIAELTKMDGFLGCASIERSSDSHSFYRGCLEHIYERQEFRSDLAGIIASAAEGCFASEFIPALLPNRVNEGEIYLWPLMAMLWAFDVDKVAERSLIANWIRSCQTGSECEEAIEAGRRRLGPRLRDVENLPPYEEMRC